MNKYNGFTKTEHETPETGCECLCLLSDSDGNVYYGTRWWDGLFMCFAVEDDEEEVIAWMALERAESVFDALN